MEKIIVLAIVFVSMGFLIRRMVKVFAGKNPCGACKNREKCLKGKNYSLFCSDQKRRRDI